jgi:hypothetical protein
MAAGIGLCLMIAAVGASNQATRAKEPEAIASAPAPELPLKPVVTPPPVQAADGVVPAQPDTVPNEALKPAPVVPLKPSIFQSRPAGLRLEIAPDGDKATLLLPLDGPPTQQEVFWLNNPTRLVVDVSERQSALDHAAYELDSSIVSRVRVGHHPGKVRFVIETGRTVDSKVSAEPDGNALRLELVSSR